MKRVIYSLFVCLLSFVSCAKDGATGPVGPAGPTGNTGATGPVGPTGSTNIKTRTVSVTSSQWLGGGAAYYYDLSIPEITQAVKDRGAVLGYMANSTNTTWLGMTWIEVSGTYFTSYAFNHSVGGVRVSSYDSDGVTLNPGTRNYKFIIMESTGLLPPTIDVTNYGTVAKYLNLETK